jgi:hypothetical protein
MSLLLMLGSLLGCMAARSPGLIGVEVQSVEVYDVRTSQFVWVLGGSAGTATLAILDTEGEVHHVKVRTGGPAFGFVFSFANSDNWRRRKTTATLDIEPGTPALLMFGRYTGTGVNGALGAGWRHRDLWKLSGNGEWREEGPSVGVSMFMGFETMWLRPAPIREQETSWLDRPWRDTPQQ